MTDRIEPALSAEHSEQLYPLMVKGARAYVRRGAHARRDPRVAEHVEVVTPPQFLEGAWKVRVRTVRERVGGTAGGRLGEERDINPSRLVPVRRPDGSVAIVA